jgi:hypothetical protein
LAYGPSRGTSDLRDSAILRAALQGVDAIYLNLATETVDLNLPFYEEREGVANLMTAIEGQHALQWIGNTRVKVYWISVVDYARQQ